VGQVSVSLPARAGRRRAMALVLALAAHVVLIAILVWQTRPWTDDERGSAQVIDVRLAPGLTLPPRPGSSRRPAAFPPIARAARLVERPIVAQTPAAPIPPSPARPTETPTAPSQATTSDASKALRAALGCDFAALADLTQAERQHCQDRLVQNRMGAPAQAFGIDPAKRAIFEANAKRALWWQDPFLATTPKNGCRPKVTNQQAAIPGGHSTSDWRAGISCGHSF